MNSKDEKQEYEIISEEAIHEPTGKYQMSGREVIYTKKTVAKFGEFTITTKANEPSPEAIKAFNKEFTLLVDEYIYKTKSSDLT